MADPTPVEQAEAVVRAYCGWHVAPSVTEDATLDGPGTGTLLLPSLHVTGVDSIVEDGAELDPTTYAWSQAGTVRKSQYGWTVWRQVRWTDTPRGVVVTYTHGYDEWPPAVQTVIDRLASRLTESSSVLTSVGGVSYATDANGTPLGGTPAPAEVAILARHKLPPRP
jgi:hypothetical protein